MYIPDDKKVLGIKGVPVNTHDPALLHVVKHPEDHVGAALLGRHPAADHPASPGAHHELGGHGGLKREAGDGLGHVGVSLSLLRGHQELPVYLSKT